jgi:FkbM family methyltransferase
MILYKLLIDYYSKAQGMYQKGLRIPLEVVRRLLIFMGDPSFRTTIRGKEILLPASHKLPIYVADHPLYDTLPGRITDFLRERDGYISMIDIGANVGDTILTCSPHAGDQFIAVEANPHFMKYLRENTSHLKHVVLLEAYCGSGIVTDVKVQIAADGGTARVSIQEEGLTLPRKSLDTILSEYPQFTNVNFIKIDTDGGDFDVLRSGRNSLAQYKPTILFECDVFGNINYVDELVELLNFLWSSGYSTAIVYDNLGYLFDVVNLDDPSSLKYALFYQMNSRLGYFDFLVLKRKDSEEFLKTETNFFIRQTSDLQIAARRALEL